MAVVNPYLIFGGNCLEAFTFYKSVFGGDFPYVGRFKEIPPMEGSKLIPAAESEKIMHKIPVTLKRLYNLNTN